MTRSPVGAKANASCPCQGAGQQDTGGQQDLHPATNPFATLGSESVQQNSLNWIRGLPGSLSEFPLFCPVEDSSSSAQTSSYASALSIHLLAGPSRADRTEVEYWFCNSSLRPISVGNEKGEVLEFMRERVKLGEEFIRSMGSITVERIPYGPKTKIS